MDDLDDLLAIGEKGGKPKGQAAPAKAPPTDDIEALLAKGETAAPAPAPTEPSLLSRVAQPFKDIGNGLLAANDFATRAITHPIDTFTKAPGATFREGMRGVNSNIPFANSAVEAMGGPPAQSPEDAAAAPGAQAFGGVAGLPVGNMVGGIAAKGIEAAAPVVGRALGRIGASAEDRGIDRARKLLEDRASKRARAGVNQDVVDTALREEPGLAKAAGNDEKVAAATKAMAQRAGGELKAIYAKSGPADEAVAKAVGNVDERIARLQAGSAEERAVAKKLQTIRDEFNDSLGARETTDAAALRKEQSAYQKAGYAKNIAGDPDVSAAIAANREMSKAVGDAVIEHVTGMNYEAAKAAAKADPNGVAARLLKANDTVNAANRLDATIADRAGRVQPEHGPMAAIKRIASHAVIPAVVGASHGPAAGLGAAVAQEALHAAPAAARATSAAADRALAGIVRAVRSGQKPTEAMIAQAIAAGVQADTIDGLTSRR